MSKFDNVEEGSFSRSATTGDMKYSVKPSAVNSRSYRTNIQPTNGSSWTVGATGGGQVVKIDIPCGRRGEFLDCSMSYLKFKITNNSTDNVPNAKATNLGNTGADVIRRLEVYHNSNLLESINEYHRLYCAMLDMGYNATDRQYGGSFMGNASADEREGVQIGAGGTFVVAIPLISGVIGQNIDKYLPVGLMQGDLRLELTLENANTALYMALATDIASYSVSEVEFVANVVEVGEEVSQGIEMAIAESGSLRIHGDSYRAYTTTHDANATSVSFLIPARFASLKTLFLIHQDNNVRSTNDLRSITNRQTQALTSYQWRIGNLTYPQKQITFDDGAEPFFELDKAMHTIGYLGGTCINVAEYDDNVVAHASNGSFLIGQDLESMAHKSDVLSSGVNTLSTNLYYDGNYGAGATAGTITAYAHYDHLLVLERGVMRVQF